MESISFINIRVTHQVQGCANQAVGYLYSDDGRLLNTLAVSPPRCGKTTLLRDIIRQVLGGPRTQHAGKRILGASVGVVDKRPESGVCYRGVSQNSLDMRTDMLGCCPRSWDMTMSVKSMASQIIVVDEVGNREGIRAIEYVRNCSYSLVAIIHGSSLGDIMQKSAVGELIHQGAFERMILLDYRGAVGCVASIWDGGGNVLYTDGGVKKVGHGSI